LLATGQHLRPQPCQGEGERYSTWDEAVESHVGWVSEVFGAVQPTPVVPPSD
jgi:hypothetical protein